MYVGKYIIEQNIMLGERYLAEQKWPVTSWLYTLFIETAENYGSVYSCFFSFNILISKTIFLYPAIYRWLQIKLYHLEPAAQFIWLIIVAILFGFKALCLAFCALLVRAQVYDGLFFAIVDV